MKYCIMHMEYPVSVFLPKGIDSDHHTRHHLLCWPDPIPGNAFFSREDAAKELSRLDTISGSSFWRIATREELEIEMMTLRIVK